MATDSEKVHYYVTYSHVTPSGHFGFGAMDTECPQITDIHDVLDIRTQVARDLGRPESHIVILSWQRYEQPS